MRDFTNAVARELENMGLEVEPREVEKANGIVLQGITIKIEETNVGMTLYTDNFEEQGYTPDHAAREMKNIYEQHLEEGIGFNNIGEELKDYEKIKDRLTVRLYNKSTKAEVSRSAKRYGFDDLILVPVINIQNGNDETGSIKVTNKILEVWGIDKNRLFKDAIANTKADIVEKSLSDMMAVIQPGFQMPDIGVKIITNKANVCGASAILGMLGSYKKKFKEGFFIIPSSIHEVLVIPKELGEDAEALTAMVREINATTLLPSEVLSQQAYAFG